MQDKDDSSKSISLNFLYTITQMLGGKGVILKEIKMQSQDFCCLGFSINRISIFQSFFPRAKIFKQGQYCLTLLPLQEVKKIFFDLFIKVLQKFSNLMGWGQDINATGYPHLIHRDNFNLIKDYLKNSKSLIDLGLGIGSYTENPQITGFSMYGGFVTDHTRETKYYICIENLQKFIHVNILVDVAAKVAQQARYDTLKKIALCRRPESALSFIKEKLNPDAQKYFISFFSEYANSPKDVEIGLDLLKQMRNKNNNNNNNADSSAYVDLYPEDKDLSMKIEKRTSVLKKQIVSFLPWHLTRKEQKELFLDVLLIFKEVQPNFSLQKHLEIISKEDPQLYQTACEGNSSKTKLLLEEIANQSYSSPSV